MKILHSVCFVDIKKSLLFTSDLLCVSVEVDFNTTSFQVVFPADAVPLPVRPSINVEIPIFDDDINERFEQLFLITSEVVDAVNPSTIDNLERNVTIGIIVDNDGRYRTSVCRCREGWWNSCCYPHVLPLSDRVHLDFVCAIFFIFIYFCYWRASRVNGTLSGVTQLKIGDICLFICMFGRTYAIFVFAFAFLCSYGGSHIPLNRIFCRIIQS